MFRRCAKHKYSMDCCSYRMLVGFYYCLHIKHHCLQTVCIINKIVKDIFNLWLIYKFNESFILLLRKRFLKNNQNTKDPSTDEQNSIKLTYEKVEGTKNDNVEEDYDHLHQNQTNACASASDNVYSHTTDNQYGLLPVITDDTYDHTVGRDGEYGTTQVCQDSENTYDHTWLPAVESAANSQRDSLWIRFQRRQPVFKLMVFLTKMHIHL